MERKEPTLSKMVPMRDDDSPRMSTTPGARHTSSPKSDAPMAAATARAPQSSSILLPLSMLLVVIALGVSGFSVVQLLELQQKNTAADVRIKDLEQRLTLTGDESSQSVTALQSNLKSAKAELEVANSEIRKLWDTRNVNRSAIAKNKQGISAAATQASTANSKAITAQRLAESQSEKVKSLSGSVALQAEKLSLLSDFSDAQQQQMRELVDKTNSLASQLNRLKNDLSKRVATNEEAVKAIDAYRLSTNRELLDLKRRLGLIQ